MAVVALVLAFLAGACGEARIERTERGDGEPRRQRLDVQLASALRSFEACDELLTYLRTNASSMQMTVALAAEDAAAGAPGRATAQASERREGVDYSGTNIQEAGADEPDVVKTDGTHLFTMSRDVLQVVRVDDGEPRLAGSLRIEGAHGAELLLAGDRLLVLHQGAYPMVDEPAPAPGAPEAGVSREAIAPYEPRAAVTVVDVSDAATPRAVSTLELDGMLVSSRLVDGVARVVLRSGPPMVAYRGEDAVERTTLDDWMPHYAYREGATVTEGRMADCDDVRRPAEFSGVEMVSVLTIDPDDPRPGPAATVVGAGEIVYATPRSLYVTTAKWDPQSPVVRTEIHKFDISDRVRTAYVATGSVDGRLLNQFSLSEQDGDLRVATTRDEIEESQVVVLRHEADELKVIGAVGGLGKGERIYAVRFLGDLGYVVTFRQVDPLYVVDLSDPASPLVRGELKIPGYSAYLHPIGGGLLIGVGQDATLEGRRLGVQVSLFDVNDPTAPAQLHKVGLGQGGTEAEYDHHAFLWWAREDLAVIPVQSYTAGTGVEAVGFEITRDGIRERGRISSPGGVLRRTVVVGDRILGVSDTEIVAASLDSFAETSRLRLV